MGACMIRTPEQADDLIQNDYLDFAVIGRALMADSQWVAKAMKGESHLIKRCISCLNCFDSLNRNAAIGAPLQCSINPDLGYEYHHESVIEDKKIRTAVVIGAGPAGLFAAENLHDSGFLVDVYESESFAGGQLKIAEKPPLKAKIAWCYEDLLQSISHKEINIHYNCKMTIDELRLKKPDHIVVATGGKPISPQIPGSDRDCVHQYNDILNHVVRLQNRKILLIGSGMSGLETAEMLALMGNEALERHSACPSHFRRI